MTCRSSSARGEKQKRGQQPNLSKTLSLKWRNDETISLVSEVDLDLERFRLASPSG